MKAVSWNVHRCIGTDRSYHPERIVEVLREVDADIVALQEIDSSLRVENGMDQLHFISDKLNMPAVMGPTMQNDYGAYGNAILSRFEVISCEEFNLSHRKLEPRGGIAVCLLFSGRKIRVVNTHLGLSYFERAVQIDRLLSEYVWREEQHVILVGDFNEWWRWTGNNLRLERPFSCKTPRIPTFPSWWPRFALDRLFVSGRTLHHVSHVHRTPLARIASDHLPLVLSVEFDFTDDLQIRTNDSGKVENSIRGS